MNTIDIAPWTEATAELDAAVRATGRAWRRVERAVSALLTQLRMGKDTT
jgi:hypothetical protein